MHVIPLLTGNINLLIISLFGFRALLILDKNRTLLMLLYNMPLMSWNLRLKKLFFLVGALEAMHPPGQLLITQISEEW